MKQTKKTSHKKPIRKRTFRKESRNVHKKSRNKSYKKIKGGEEGKSTNFHLALMIYDKDAAIAELQRVIRNDGIEMINAKNKDGDTPLHYATRFNERAGEILIENGADVNVIDRYGNTPLHIACNGDYLENMAMAMVLIKNGANVTAKIIDTENRKKELNFDKKKELNGMGKGNGTALDETPLSIVCKKGNGEILKKMIGAQYIYLEEEQKKKRINEDADLADIIANIINSTNKYRTFDDKGVPIWVGEMTPLHYAARYGTRDQVKVLIENGANVQAKDSNGWTPLQHACGRSRQKSDNVKVTQELITKMKEEDIKEEDINKVLENNYCHRAKMSFHFRMPSQFSIGKKVASVGRNLGRMWNSRTINDVDREKELIEELKNKVDEGRWKKAEDFWGEGKRDGQTGNQNDPKTKRERNIVREDRKYMSNLNDNRSSGPVNHQNPTDLFGLFFGQ